MPPEPRSTRRRSRAHFQQEAVQRVADLRGLFEKLIGCLPAPVSSATALQRATGLDMKLCWKVYRVVSAPDTLAAAQYVPGPANMRSLIETMSRLGAPAELLDKVAAAGEEFDTFVAAHAGDRRTFDSMVSGFAGADNEQKTSQRQRRAAFQATSHIWGVQADALVMAMIQRPSAEDPARLDEIGLRAEYGVRRLRPTPAPLYEQSFSILDRHGRDLTEGRRRPLSGSQGEIGLIPHFCTDPLPPVEVRQGAGGWANAVLMHTELGIKAAVDLAMGFRLDGLSPRYLGEETHGWAIVHITKPFRTVVIDWIVEEGALPAPPRPFGFISTKNTKMAPPEDLWTTAQLTDGEPIRHLGRGAEVLGVSHAPRYAEMVDWAIRSAGWDPARFETWRLRVEYPVTLTSVGLAYEMQPAPK